MYICPGRKVRLNRGFELFVVGLFVVFTFFLLFFLNKFSSERVDAASTTLTHRADWSSGKFDGVEADSQEGDLKLKSAGSWGPKVWRTPSAALTVGTGLASDGTYLYVLEGAGNYFSRYDPDSNTWESLEDADHGTYYGADLVVLGDYIYAIFGGYQKEFARYSIIDDSWTDMDELPDLVYRGASLATDGTDIYAVRGYNTSDFWKYDVASDTWMVAPNAPATLYYGASLEYHDGYLYTPRGRNRNTFYRYDISGESWSTMTNAPGTFNGDGTCDVMGDYIYCLRNSNNTTFWRYDIDDDSWDTLTNAPQNCRYVGVVYNSEDDQLYVFRGNNTYDFWKYDEGNDEFLGPAYLEATPDNGADLIYYDGYLYHTRGGNSTDFYRYNISSDSWESRTATPANFNDDTKGVEAGGLIYFFRGGNTQSFYSYDPSGNSWSTSLSDTPANVRYGGSLIYPGAGDYIYATRGSYSRSFWRYSISGNSWDDGAVADIPDNGEASYGARLAYDGTDIYYFSGSRTSKLFKYVIDTDTWSEVGNLPYGPFYGTDVAYYSGNFYVIAGWYKKEFWEYDISEDTWRQLDPIGDYYGTDAGSYDGGSLETDGTGDFYQINGVDQPNMSLSTVDSSSYLESGEWISDPLDLTYVSSWTSLTSTTTTPGDSSISIQTRSSVDQATWSSWEALSGNSIQSPTRRYLQIKVTLSASTDRSQAPDLHSLSVNYTGDTSDPTNPGTFTGSSQEVSGVSLTNGETYGYANPYFSWSGASDSESGVEGYYVYFGTNASGDPETVGTYQTNTDYVVLEPMSAGTYYFRLQTKDVAGNISSATTGFTYVYQGVPSSSSTITNTADFNAGALSNVAGTSDQLKLSGKSGFWLEHRLSNTPANMRMGADMAYVSSTQKIYAFRGNNTTAFYEYDIATDTWSSLAAAPDGVRYGGAIVEGPSGYLYAFRGNNTTEFWRYDIEQNEWSDGDADDAPQTVYYGGCLVYDGDHYIYAFRGNNDDSFLRYDTQTDSWGSVTSADFGAPATQVNNLVRMGGDLTFDGEDTIYAIQGNTRTGFASYSISEDEWTPLTNTPAQVYYGGRIEYVDSENAIYFIPGWNKPFFYKYDISGGTWMRLTDSPLEFYHGASMRAVDTDIYILRGDNSTYFYKYDTADDSWKVPTRGIFGSYFRGSNYRYFYYGAEIIKGDGDYYYMTRGYYDNLFARYNPSTGESVLMANVPASFYVGGTLAYESTNNKIYASASQYDDSLYIYDIATDTWTEDGDDPFPANPGTGTTMVYDGSRYIYWARGNGSTTFYRYDTQGSTGSMWESRSSVPGSVGYGAQLVYKDSYIYVMRGNNVNPNPIYRYDPSGDTWYSGLSDSPGRIYNDGFLVDGGGDYLYACRGANTTDCWRYSISGDSWSAIATAPGQIYYGGSAATSGDGKIYVVAGSGSNTYNDGVYTYIAETSSTSFEEDGTYTSAAHDLTAVYRWSSLDVTYTSAPSANVAVETRSSANGSDWTSWEDVSEEKHSGTSYSYKINSDADRYIQVRFTFASSDGIYSAIIDDYTINYYQDTSAPINPSTLNAYSDSTPGTSITTDTWYPHTIPHFDWPDAEAAGGATDTVTGSGVVGYYVYFGTNALADPQSGELIASSEYTASGLVSGQTYYLRIKTVDDAGNVSDTAWAPFTYKFDSGSPDVPSDLSADPSGYSALDSFDFTWLASSDSASGVASYCYRTGTTSGEYASDQCTESLSVDGVPSYQSGTNIFYVRAKDTAGNYSSYATVSYYYSSDAPSPPQNLTVTPAESTSNSFAFEWEAPEIFYGSAANLTYHYSVNALPTAQNVQTTSLTSLTAGAYATLPGANTFYIVAEDEAGNVDYSNPASVTFSANTEAPGIPTSVDIADVSVKATSSWKIAVSWEEPTDVGAGVASYKIYRSTDGSDFTETASTGGISYVDTGLTQRTYYYKIKACDNANNCGALSSSVSLYPDGKFTEPAPLVGEPAVSGITTKKSTIDWTTSRTADSKIAYGTSSGDYFDEEVGSSSHVTAHTVTITNLSPGTTYYFVAKWTDEDGNLGTSDEYTFDTEPAPSAKEVGATDVSLFTANIKFTSKDASKARIYYGETMAFGGLKEISVSSTETEYTVPLSDLNDGTKYYYKVNLLDIEDEEYEGDVYSFQTLPKPTVSNVKVAQIRSEAQPTILVTWETNTDISSIITYYPSGNPAAAKDAVNVTRETGKHRMLIKGLLPETNYSIIVSGQDAVGNEASSDVINIATATDTRPPRISNLKIEGSVLPVGGGEANEMQAQLVVSWDTDEAATSQVEFGEGSGDSYSQSTQEDTSLTFNHVVVISSLTPSKVYHLRAVSRDDADNEGGSIDTVTITPKATDNALDLVVSNLQQVFGFLEGVER